jgi:hypothetical protein
VLMHARIIHFATASSRAGSRCQIREPMHNFNREGDLRKQICIMRFAHRAGCSHPTTQAGSCTSRAHKTTAMHLRAHNREPSVQQARRGPKCEAKQKQSLIHSRHREQHSRMSRKKQKCAARVAGVYFNGGQGQPASHTVKMCRVQQLAVSCKGKQ